MSQKSGHGAPAHVVLGLEDMLDGAFGGEGEHEARESAEEHTDADERADHPDGAARPGTPDHDG